jgi:hypothetical protein
MSFLVSLTTPFQLQKFLESRLQKDCELCIVEAVLTYFKVLIPYLSGSMEEIHENLNRKGSQDFMNTNKDYAGRRQ